LIDFKNYLIYIVSQDESVAPAFLLPSGDLPIASLFPPPPVEDLHQPLPPSDNFSAMLGHQSTTADAAEVVMQQSSFVQQPTGGSAPSLLNANNEQQAIAQVAAAAAQACVVQQAVSQIYIVHVQHT
jgi:hypothetical protein